jgi:ribosomal protein S8
MKFLKLLIKLNYINYMYKPIIINKKRFNNFYYVSINTENPLNNIQNLYRPSSLRTITYRELITTRLLKKNLLILSTNKGVLTSSDAIKYKIGGVLILNLCY